MLLRAMTPVVTAALEDTRIVMVEGARQVGKSTLAAQICATQGGAHVTLDDDVARAAARRDPEAFVTQNRGGLLVIDEAQRVPELFLALKLQVDRDPAPGRYLVTGSADFHHVKGVGDSLAGRTERLLLYGFSQGELRGKADQFVDLAFEAWHSPGGPSPLGRADYLAAATAGSYPEAVSRTERRRSAWFRSYLDAIVGRDAGELARLAKLRDLPKLLDLIAARQGHELDITSLANNLGMPRTTLGPYLELLGTLFLTQSLPAWSPSATSRAIKSPKVMLLDSGLAATLRGLTTQAMSPGAIPDAAGGLLEGFVAGELRRQLGWSQTDARISHFRDRDRREVDLVLESREGLVVGIGVKAAGSIKVADTRGLARLRDILGRRFVAGYILNTGPRARLVGERIWAMPIDALWEAAPVSLNQP
jgi:predicted AAA+ superfamily ATPase